MFYLLLAILTLAGVYLLLNGEWVFRIQQDRRGGLLATAVMLAAAAGWDVAQARLGDVLPSLYPLAAVAGGMFLGLGLGGLTGAAVAVVATATAHYLGLTGSQQFLHLLSSLVLYTLIGLIIGRVSDRLREMAFSDSLTGLHNRRYFFEEAEPEVARALRYHFPLSLLIVDLDYFKAYNDRLGHVAGDMALRRFADILRTGSREGDLIARYGGEEFVIALSHTDSEAAVQYAERLRESVQALYGHGPVQLTVSVGISSLPGYDSLDALVQAADAALYQAKDQRNRVSVAVPEAPPEAATAAEQPAATAQRP